MLEHCRAAGDKGDGMLGDELAYELAGDGKFICFFFHLEITVEHPVAVQVVQGE